MTTEALPPRKGTQGRRDNGMPPLRLQYEAGYSAFNNTKQWTKQIDGATVLVTTYPYKLDTMQAKEWQRGYNTAYFENLEKLNVVRR